MSTRKPLVSVLIDTYNYGCYVEEAIESALGQEFPAAEREILVVDDGSTDDTAERVRKFGGAITYFRKPNGGQASAFNFGLRHARGKYVAFLDADDFWLPGKLSRTVEEFEKNPEAGMVYHAYCEWNAAKGLFRDAQLPLISGFLPAEPDELLKYVLYPTSFLSFRRSVIDLLLPVPEALTIQADAFFSALAVFVAPIVAIPDRLAVYRIHASNLFADGGKIDSRRRELRMRTRTALVRAMKTWMDERAYALDRPELIELFKQWELTQEGDEFDVVTPGRLKIARHLVRYASHFKARMTWRHRAVTCLNAAGSLIVGYKNIHKLDEWRKAITHPFRSCEGRRGVKMNKLNPLRWTRIFLNLDETTPTSAKNE
jgi:glycosyltransferase involved in cell wall biosynthesis